MTNQDGLLQLLDAYILNYKQNWAEQYMGKYNAEMLEELRTAYLAEKERILAALRTFKHTHGWDTCCFDTADGLEEIAKIVKGE